MTTTDTRPITVDADTFTNVWRAAGHARATVTLILADGRRYVIATPTWITNGTHLEGWTPEGISVRGIAIADVVSFELSAPNRTKIREDERAIADRAIAEAAEDAARSMPEADYDL